MTDFFIDPPQGLKVLQALSRKKIQVNLIQGNLKPITQLVSSRTYVFDRHKDVLKPKVSSLSDQHLEMLVFLKDRKQNTAFS